MAELLAAEKRLAAIILALPMLVACEPPKAIQGPRPDQQLRREIFMECMRSAPAGPQSTKYNDWSEVVDECGSQAYYISLQLGDQKVEK